MPRGLAASALLLALGGATAARRAGGGTRTVIAPACSPTRVPARVSAVRMDKDVDLLRSQPPPVDGGTVGAFYGVRGAGGPPIGATYRSAEFSPLFGGLVALKLDVTGKSTARIQLSGGLTVSDSLSYEHDETTGRLYVELGAQVRRLLSSLDITLVDAVYSARSDSAYVTIKPPALQPYRMFLYRVHPPAARSGARRSASLGEVRAAAARDAQLRGDGGAVAAADQAQSLLALGVGGVAGAVSSVTGSVSGRVDAVAGGVSARVSRARAELVKRIGNAPWPPALLGPRAAVTPPRAAQLPSAAAAAASGAPAPAAGASDARAAAADAPLVAPSRPATLPPVGAVYERTLRLPVIGMQTVRLSIGGEIAARIQLEGSLALDEALRYGVDAKGGSGLSFTLSEGTQRLLRGMGIALTAADYEPATDTASVTIKPPAIPPIRIELHRVVGAVATEPR